MKIKELKIEGFKSIGQIALSEPNPFSVFVGPNASGKSNIFEALEFLQLCDIMPIAETTSLFGNLNDIFNQLHYNKPEIRFEINLGTGKPVIQMGASSLGNGLSLNSTYQSQFGKIAFTAFKKADNTSNLYNSTIDNLSYVESTDYIHFTNFTRLFVRNTSLLKRKIQDDSRLALDASNLEKVLKRILKNENSREEILEILQLLVPEFENIEIKTEELSGSDNLLIYEKALQKPLTKHLISDGTYNLIALLAAIFQSEQPQFLCIEEPENGLNPKVVKQLVSLFRDKCKENGHYIWLNTHSQSLVAELHPEEIILVDKKDGLTQVKQVKGLDLHGMRMDEALLTNALDGGIPW